MKKKSLFMALAAMFVLAFASCNNEPEITGPGIDDGDDKPQPTEGIFSWEFSTSFGEVLTTVMTNHSLQKEYSLGNFLPHSVNLLHRMFWVMSLG